MLYRFDATKQELDALTPVGAAQAGVLEKQIEIALSRHPESLIRSGANGSPLFVVKNSVPYRKMPDVIALDAEGRLVLVECKRGWATRDAIAQLLEYASEFHADPTEKLKEEWKTSQRNNGKSLIESFREFADDPEAKEENLGREHVLIVVAAGKDESFERIAAYLQQHGVPVYLVTVQLFRRTSNGELFLEMSPIDLTETGPDGKSSADKLVWMFNTDETHCKGASQKLIDKGVAAIWGYPDGPTVLQGSKAGDVIYAYQNGVGIIARGEVLDGKVQQATSENEVFAPPDKNEWNIPVRWTAMTPVKNSEVSAKAGAGLPVRNTFCRLWNPKVRSFLSEVGIPKEASK